VCFVNRFAQPRKAMIGINPPHHARRLTWSRIRLGPIFAQHLSIAPFSGIDNFFERASIGCVDG